jgi:hypothetical protein
MMINNTFFEKSNLDTNQINFQKCIKIGNNLMITAFIVMVTCVFITFIFEQNFSLMNQVIAHISIIITAEILKIGYVIRCVGAHGLGHKAF